MSSVVVDIEDHGESSETMLPLYTPSDSQLKFRRFNARSFVYHHSVRLGIFCIALTAIVGVIVFVLDEQSHRSGQNVGVVGDGDVWSGSANAADPVSRNANKLRRSGPAKDLIRPNRASTGGMSDGNNPSAHVPDSEEDGVFAALNHARPTPLPDAEPSPGSELPAPAPPSPETPETIETPSASPTVAPSVEPEPPKSQTTPKQEAVRAAFVTAWEAYKKYAWGYDELDPVRKRSKESFHLALTMVDGLDTLWLMGERERFAEASEWISTQLNITPSRSLNLFETTIRVLGGLLSSHHLSGNSGLLTQASKLGHALFSAFQKINDYVPYSDIHLTTHQGTLPGRKVSVSEAATVQLEFKFLSHLTHDESYFSAMNTCSDSIDNMRKRLGGDFHGLVPMYIDLSSRSFEYGSVITLGARGDSYYEYLLKQWLLTNKTETVYRDRYIEAMEGVTTKLIAKTQGKKGWTFVAELSGGSQVPKMDHLVCFLPGLLALGVMSDAVTSPATRAEHTQLAKDLTETCVGMYDTATGLAPEIVHFHTNLGASEEMYIKPADAHNILRPETVESLFYLYRLTHDARYQNYGWRIFQAFEKYSKVGNDGYSGLDNVQSTSSSRRENMESFFLAETLKYLYLLFDDSATLLPLDQFVFNTEAHPLPIFTPKFK